jgi:fatty acid kinase fatty acid binding subunit
LSNPHRRQFNVWKDRTNAAYRAKGCADVEASLRLWPMLDLTTDNTAIVLDSTADLPDAKPPHTNWRVVPLYVNLGDRSYRDWVDIGPDELLEHLDDSPPPTTSLPSPGDFAATYAELGGYERIFSVHISSKLSGTFGSASIAAEAETGRVVPIDSRVASVGILLVCEALQRRLARGTSEDELRRIAARCAETTRVVSTYRTLEHLVRVGRAGQASRLVGQILDSKPILELRDGEHAPVGRVRGWSRALGELGRIFEEGTHDGTDLHVAIAHADAADAAEQVAADVRTRRPHAAVDLITPFGPVNSSAVGPGALALCFLEDEPD